MAIEPSLWEADRKPQNRWPYRIIGVLAGVAFAFVFLLVIAG
jgi:hypothetical protein